MLNETLDNKLNYMLGSELLDDAINNSEPTVGLTKRIFKQLKEEPNSVTLISKYLLYIGDTKNGLGNYNYFTKFLKIIIANNIQMFNYIIIKGYYIHGWSLLLEDISFIQESTVVKTFIIKGKDDTELRRELPMEKDNKVLARYIAKDILNLPTMKFYRLYLKITFKEKNTPIRNTYRNILSY